MARILLLLVCTVFASAGCSRTTVQTWVREQGGLVAGARQARVDAVAQPLLRQFDGRQLQVRVLDSDAVTAYGWRDGTIFLTRRLIDLMQDDELAAAIAHELGHLLADGHVHSVTSLRGCDHEENLETEHRADLIGAQLLRKSSISPAAMTRMLQKVRDQQDVSTACRRAIATRVELLVNAPPASNDPAQLIPD